MSLFLVRELSAFRVANQNLKEDVKRLTAERDALAQRVAALEADAWWLRRSAVSRPLDLRPTRSRRAGLCSSLWSQQRFSSADAAGTCGRPPRHPDAGGDVNHPLDLREAVNVPDLLERDALVRRRKAIRDDVVLDLNTARRWNTLHPDHPIDTLWFEQMLDYLDGKGPMPDTPTPTEAT